MKKRLLALALTGIMVLSLASCGDGKSSSDDAALNVNVKTGGSTSVEKVMTALIYKFQESNRSITVDYEMNGSGDGIKGVASGKYEIGHSSRSLKGIETAEGLESLAYAIDGIALVVNKENTVSELTQAQTKDIYTGKIKNWKEVGGKDAPITVIIREAGSGTRSAFGKIVGIENTELVTGATECKDTGAVQTTVSQNANAIGYISFSDMDASVVTPVKYEGILISTDTLKDGSYKLQRSFLLVIKKDAKLTNTAQALIDFILSDEGQKLVTDNKLISVK